MTQKLTLTSSTGIALIQRGSVILIVLGATGLSQQERDIFYFLLLKRKDLLWRMQKMKTFKI